ncbi:hypothetical protein ACGFZ2_29280, partial [Micromonospora sp. NPDC048063]
MSVGNSQFLAFATSLAPKEPAQVVPVRGAGITLGITLTVRGVVVTGTLIGRDEWAEGMAELLKSAGENGELLGSRILDVFRKLDLNRTRDENSEPYSYIHLKDARYVAGHGLLPSPGSRVPVYWRGRLSEVSGWSLGTLGE